MLSDNVIVKLNPRVLYNRPAFVLCFIDLLRDLEDGAELMDETRENNVNEARQPSYVPSTDDFTLIEITPENSSKQSQATGPICQGG